MLEANPVGARIIVAPLEVTLNLSSGILLPETARALPTKGIVTAVGRGKHALTGGLVPVDILEGDIVLFEKNAGTEILVEGELLYIIDEEHVLAVVDEKNVLDEKLNPVNETDVTVNPHEEIEQKQNA